MPEIRVTEEQKRRLDELREELAAAYVDGYGHVRPRDAIEYLLDTYTPPDGAAADASASADTPGEPTPASGEDTAPDAGDADPDAPDADAAPLNASGLSGEAPGGGSADASDATTVVTTDDDDGDSLGADDSRVAASLSLLDDHEDKWRPVESGDAPYEVELPDGSTESARTKDDVRRLLFTHY